MFTRVRSAVILVLALALGAGAILAQAAQVNVYSGRAEGFIRPVLEAFTQRTGIRVNLRSGATTQLAALILEEQRNPVADVFITNDGGALEALRLQGLLQPYLSPAVRQIPENLRARDGSWVGVSGRSRVIMYNTNLVGSENLPTSVFDLAEPRYRNRIAMPDPTNESFVSWVSSLIALRGEAATESYLRALRANNVRALGGHTQVREAVGAGEFHFGLVNHYYFHRSQAEGAPVGIIYPDQGPGEVGVLVNVAGAGIVKNAPNLAAAGALIDYLLTPDAQRVFAEANFEYPLLPGIAPTVARPLDQIRLSPYPLDRMGPDRDLTVSLIERTGIGR
jgi:iron(III) transport system substrate-binding protein